MLGMDFRFSDIEKDFLHENVMKLVSVGKRICFVVALFEAVMIVYALIAFDFSTQFHPIYFSSYIALSLVSCCGCFFCYVVEKGVCTVKDKTIKGVMLFYISFIACWSIVLGILDEMSGSSNIVFLTVMLGISGIASLTFKETILFFSSNFVIFIILHSIFVESFSFAYIMNVVVYFIFILLTSLISLRHNLKSYADQKQLLDKNESYNDLVEQLFIANSRLKHLSKTDPLTGLNNRSNLHSEIEKQFKQQLSDKAHISVAMIDIDDFKIVNDTFGHHIGDVCLMRLSNILTKFVNPKFVFRYGGEEFFLILPFDENLTTSLLTNILHEVAATEFHTENSSKPFHITVSIGYYTATHESKDEMENLILLADKALYKAKNNGKNQVFGSEKVIIPG